RTVEGLAADGRLDPVQQGFAQCHGLQCGFCTPGMMLTARWLLDHNPDPTAEEIREALSGQVCRCTGYENIVRAVQWTSRHDAAGREPGPAAGREPGPAASRGPGPAGESTSPPGSRIAAPMGRPAGKKTRVSSAAAAPSSTMCSFPGCCTARSCAARSRTPGSARSTR